MMSRPGRDKYFDYVANIDFVIDEYIPKQLLEEYKNSEPFAYNGALHLIQIIVKKSNNKLRMYGTAEELESNLTKYYEQYPKHTRLDSEIGEKRSTTPTKYRNLKGELFYCKQELLSHFQTSTHIAFRVVRQTISAEFKKYMKSHKTRLFGCYEFVKYDQKIFEELKEKFHFSDSLRDFIYSPDMQIEILTRTVISLPSCPDAGTFEKLIEDHPSVFLPNCEVENGKLTVVVRIFEDGGKQFVMESEFFNAVNLLYPDRAPLKLTEINGILRTRTLQEVFTNYRDFIKEIEFIRCPINRTKHVAVPIVTPTGGLCVLISDFIIETFRQLIFGLNLFQKLKKNTWHLMEEFVDILEKMIPRDLDGIGFIDLKLVNEFRQKTDEYWKDFEKNPKVVEV